MVHRLVEQKQVRAVNREKRERQSGPFTIGELAGRSQHLFRSQQELMEEGPYLSLRADGQLARLGEGSFIEIDALVLLAIPPDSGTWRPDDLTGADRYSPRHGRWRGRL